MSAEPRQATAGSPPGAGRLPDFFIVGHHKSGTTALYEMLSRHPGIYMSPVKEPRYFAGDLRALAGRPDPPTEAEGREYRALFAAARADQRVGEASPSYLRSATAAAEIAAVAPRARSIAILREPASFVRSLHYQLMQGHVVAEPDLRKAFAAERVTRNGNTVLRYSDHIRYVEQLRRYHERFGRERVLVIIYDDFRADNEATVKQVLRFLDVDDSVAIEPVEANPAVEVRSMRLDSLVGGVYASRGPLARTARALVPGRVRSGMMRAFRQKVVYARPPEADEEFMRELRVRFKGEVEALSEYLGRDLVSLWGYENLA